jgi:hypothetical protein
MKKIILTLALLFTLSLALSAGKPGRIVPLATIVVSPTIYTSGSPMTFVGSGYTAGQVVLIDVSGPNFLEVYTTADKRGNVNVYYPGGLVFPAGYYTVTAHQSDGTTATTGLEVL